MPKRIGEDTQQITLRLERDLIERAEKLAESMAPPNMRSFDRADILRAALTDGLKRMEASKKRTTARRRKAS